MLCLFLLKAEAAKQGVTDGLRLCGMVLIPALGPISVLAGVLRRTGAAERLGKRLNSISARLLGLPGSVLVPVLAGLLGGFPLGASYLAQMKKEKRISRENAIRISPVCNQAGTAFVLGVVGGLLGSKALGVLLWAINGISGLFAAMLFCRGRQCAEKVEQSAPEETFGASFSASVAEAANSMLQLTGSVCFFSALTKAVSELIAPYVDPGQASAQIGSLLSGILELTSGVIRAEGLRNYEAIPILAFLIGWGGLCVHLQAAQAFYSAELPVKRMLLGKAVQAGIASGLAMLAAAALFADAPDWYVPIGGISVGWFPLARFLRFFQNRSGKTRKLCYNGGNQLL